MFALAPPLFPKFVWPCGDHSLYENDVNNMFLDFPRPDLAVAHQNVSSESNGILLDDTVVMKKLSHNARERDRRKKINSMLSSLRSCLPTTEQSKKLSVSATVSLAVKYIPELQEQVKKLEKKKEELSLQISGKRDLVYMYTDQNGKLEKGVTSYASTVSATMLGDNEVMVQISSVDNEKRSFGNVLSGIEDHGLVLMDVSSSRSQGERLFYTLHLLMDDCKLNLEELSDRLLCLYEKCENSTT